MCVPKCQPKGEKLSPLFLKDVTINVDDSYKEAVIPESVLHHTDRVYLNFSVQDGILAFVYESSFEILIVYTSSEAKEICKGLNTNEEEEEENHFLESDEEENPFTNSYSDQEDKPLLESDQEEYPLVESEDLEYPCCIQMKRKTLPSK